MHASHQHPHQERPGVSTVCSPSADYAVVPSTSPFSALHLLRNYRLFGSGAGPAVAAAAAAAAAAADLVTNPRYELLYPTHQSLLTPGTCSYRDYGVVSEGYKQDSSPFASSSSKRLLLAEDSASSSSPPALASGASSTTASLTAALALPANQLRQATVSASSEPPQSNLLRSAVRQPVLVNMPQQFSDPVGFAESEVNGPRRFFIGDAGVFPGCRSRRPRSEKRPIPDEQKDDKYYERRKRNNQAAKKSRDARKIREDHIALRATMLEHENAILRTQILTLREEAQSLRRMLIEQRMPKLATRYAMECPRPAHSSPAPPSTASSRAVVSTAPKSPSNGSLHFSHPTTKVATTLFL